MALPLDKLGTALRTLEVSDLTMLPRFTAEDGRHWPEVLTERPKDRSCAVDGDHPATMSTTIGHPQSGLPERWLDLCHQHAGELQSTHGVALTWPGEDAGAIPGASLAAGGDVVHPFTTAFADAVAGRFPDGDRPAEVVGPLPGPCDAVVFLPGRTVVAADVDPAWVRDQLAGDADRAPADVATGPGRFVAGLAARLGHPASFASVVTVAPLRAPMLRGRLTVHAEPDEGWSAYRQSVQSYRYHSGNADGRIDIGRGPAGRIDVYPRLDAARGISAGGPSRELMTAAVSLAPSDERVFGSAPLHDTHALRTLVDGGFTPLGTEVLFLTRPA